MIMMTVMDYACTRNSQSRKYLTFNDHAYDHVAADDDNEDAYAYDDDNDVDAYDDVADDDDDDSLAGKIQSLFGFSVSPNVAKETAAEQNPPLGPNTLNPGIHQPFPRILPCL